MPRAAYASKGPRYAPLTRPRAAASGSGSMAPVAASTTQTVLVLVTVFLVAEGNARWRLDYQSKPYATKITSY